MNEKLLTIVTPTYNRESTLYGCYNSLLKQRNMPFIWMVVDDGSTDNTKSLVEKWIKENKIEIKYFKKSNGGKASALNTALENVSTDYFVCLDSDDFFSDDAIELALNKLNSIKNNEAYAGVLALRNTIDGEVMGGKEIPESVREVTLTELTNIYNIRSELITFYKYEAIKNIRFPEIPGEKFISPQYLEHEVGRKFKFLAARETYCYCEYLPDGLTNNKLEIIKKNPKGYTLVIKQAYDLSVKFIPRCKYGVMYVAGSLLSGEKKIITNSLNPLLTTLLFPLGWWAYKNKFR